MSRKIAVLDHHQKSGEAPRQYYKKRVVESLVACLAAEWVIYGILAKMLPETHGMARLAHYKPRAEQDAKLPSAELPGLSFMLRGKKVWGANSTVNWLKEMSQSSQVER
jgi:hypothetical protein